MDFGSLNKMKNGWFIGDFEPSFHKSDLVEVAVKYYKKGDYEQRHFHKVATEFTLIVDGEVEMNGNILKKGEIVKILPGESTDFKVLKDTITVVVKLPSIKNDKFISL